jgi:protein-tyrosine-phosphatase
LPECLAAEEKRWHPANMPCFFREIWVYFLQKNLIQCKLEDAVNLPSSSRQPPGVFKLLGHEIRWNIVTLLTHSDYCGQELVRLLRQPQNLLSYHLQLLHTQGVITERRSTADERSIYYSLNLDTLRTLYFASADALHPALHMPQQELQELEMHLPVKQVRVLFLCTHNSARSQMAEGILRHMSQGNIEVFSAGSTPSTIHPLAVQALAAMGIDMSQHYAKHMNEFQGQAFDYIVTVCDRIHESCPTFPGDPEQIHWSFPDPTAVEGSEQERSRAFEQIALQLTTRIRYLLILIERTYGNMGEKRD